MGLRTATEFIQRTAGLNTVLDPERLQVGTRTNGYEVEFAEAVNVSIDERGLTSLRPGNIEEQSGEFHSLFCDGGDCFLIQERTSDAAIMKVNGDYSLTGIRSGLTKNLHMQWLQINTDTFYSNGTQNGYIRSGVSSAWPAGTSRGPDSEVAEFLSSAPVANQLAIMPGGQMVIGVGDAAYINHEPFQFGLFSPRKGYIRFESDLTMLCGNRSGFFASDGKQTWFFRKVDGGWYRFKQEFVDAASVIAGSLATDEIDLVDIGIDQPGTGRVWLSNKGICIGTDAGTVINLTKDKIKLPAISGHGAGLVKESTAIFTLS